MRYPPTEFDILELADSLHDKLAELAESFRSVATALHDMRSGADPMFVESILATRLEMSPEDAKTFAAIGELLANNDLSDSRPGMSPFALKAISEARSDVREDALRMLQLEYPIDSERLERIRIHRDRINQGEPKVAEELRAAALESFAARRAKREIPVLELATDRLLSSLETFVAKYVPEDSSGSLNIDDAYVGAHAKIQSEAAAVLKEFERVLGDNESFEAADKRDFQVIRLKWAYDVLGRLASGRFGHVGGFALEDGPDALFSNEFLVALFYIASSDGSEHEFTPYKHPAPPYRLKVLELCAGAGGQAIGLMSAGFDHVALYDNATKRVRTLRKNWPRWPVVQKNLYKMTNKDFDLWKGIDLLAGGPPCEPFSKANTKKERRPKNNLFPIMVRAVRRIRPRAFMFENVMGMELANHAAYLAGVCTDLTNLGYKVDIVRINAKDYGLPQSRERLVIVGIRSDQPGTFLPPLFISRSGYVSGVLGSAVIVHEHPKSSLESGAHDPEYVDDVYESWARTWRERYKSETLPTITSTSTETRSERLRPMARAGFDASSFADRPPTRDEVTGDDFLPRLTTGVIARAQGFPARWSFDAEKTGNIAMIADAFPPILAKAVALRIFTALTGEEFDMDRALFAEPLIANRLIGRDPALPPFRREALLAQMVNDALEGHRVNVKELDDAEVEEFDSRLDRARWERDEERRAFSSDWEHYLGNYLVSVKRASAKENAQGSALL